MSKDHRETILRDLAKAHGIAWGRETKTQIMNHLQERGLVSDNSITLDEVADCDLVRAWNATLP